MQNELPDVAHTMHDDWHGHAEEVPLKQDRLRDPSTGLNHLRSVNSDIELTAFDASPTAENARATDQKLIETNLQTALEKAEFVLYYQPKIKLDTGAITGAEVLLRWIHPELGIVLPDRFLRVAEETGVIIPIGRWILAKACRQMKQWINADLGPLTLSVNISATELHQVGFVENVRTTLQDSGLEPASLVLEVNETALMRDLDASIAILQALKTLGVQLVLDNYGAGGTGPKHLQLLPIDAVKIDRAFVEEIQLVSKGVFIANAIIGMANKLNLKVIADGIESQVQHAYLQSHACAEGQGYLFSPAVSAASFSILLESGIVATFDYKSNMVSNSESARLQASWLSN